MPKKKTPDLDPKEQFKRFQKAAKEAGVNDADAEKAFKGIASAPHRERTKGGASEKKAQS
jgi:hypothetical protein